jgi:recombinational DNA repair ATPase RecF
MASKIEKVKIKNFKGAAGTLELEFDKNKPIIMIFGENGTGKSTIFDAIDFVCNERFGSIADRSVAKKHAEYLPTIGYDKNQMEASISTDNGTWVGKIGARSLPSTAGPSDNRPKVEILRRSRILNIVNAQPKERYEAIKDFIEVPSCEANEAALREALKRTKRSYEDAVKAVEQSQSALDTLWEREGKPEPDAILWANQIVTIDDTVREKTLKDVNAVLSTLTACTTANNAIIRTKTEYETALKRFNEAEDKYDKARKELEGDVGDIIEVLTQAQNYFKKITDIDICPVCEQSIVSETLIARIDERLSTMKGQIALRKVLDDARRTLENKISVYNTRRTDFYKSVLELKDQLINSKLPMIVNIGINFSKYDLADTLDNGSIEHAEELYKTVSEIANQLDEEKENISSIKAKQKSIQTYLDSINNNIDKAENLQIVLERLDSVLSIISEERRNYVDNVLKTIAGEAERLYVAVHPDEGIGKVRWYLNPKFQGSLEFEGQFQNATNVPPQAYYSESHLDTLGVCVFLAMAKQNMDDNAVVILDDVITSVDQVHMERFFKLLNDEAEHFSQLIIGTHYRPWRDRYRFYSGTGSNVQLIELQNWTLQKGIQHSKTKFSVEELRDSIAATPFDRQLVASKAGILLEGLLDRLSRQFLCRLPLKSDHSYTLSEYSGGFNNRLRSLLRVEKKKSDEAVDIISFGEKIVGCTEQTWVRNQVGCHFNVSGMEISDTDVKEFGNRVLDIAITIVCNNCGEYPSRKKSGSYWECRCGETHMFPLSAP